MSGTSAADGLQPFSPPERFSLVRRLGAGGMGVVYEALDQVRGVRVALKTLQRADPVLLYSLKQEFRSLAEITHSNLAGLYELICHVDQWFIVMEFVPGQHFLDYVWYGHDASLDEHGETSPLTATLAYVSPSEFSAGSVPALCPITLLTNAHQTRRLSDALVQLAAGVSALHTAGKLHRDIKPSNVLVTPEGRVVLLDFGLVRDFGPHFSLHPRLHRREGTLGYMSPEQASGCDLTEASDWYSVGAMLFQAITGQLPSRSQREGWDRISLAPDLEHLRDLCIDLLQREAERRPSGTEVLARVGQIGISEAPKPALAAKSELEVPFTGRERHMRFLEAALADMESGRTISVYIHGASGVGKTELCGRFLRTLAQRDDVVVLAGRCYEQECVPYKAVDSLVDALSQYLETLDEVDAAQLVPRDVSALARIFPVLRRVPLIAQGAGRNLDTTDELEIRRRAFGALREMLARLGDRKRAVIFIDDLQWGDVDSAALLSEILRPPDAPVLLLLGAYRDEYVTKSACLRALLQPNREQDARDLKLEPLNLLETRRLVLKMLGRDDAFTQDRAEQIAVDSGGNPYFVLELVQSLHTAESALAVGSEPADPAHLDAVVMRRIETLPADARRLLEVIAIAGFPLRQMDAYRAAGMRQMDPALLSALRSGRLLRTTGPNETDEVETYHDRIRETIVDGLPAEWATSIHRSLAFTLEETGIADPETLAIHFEAAGERQRAGQYFALGAEQANRALAFTHAADLFDRAIQLLELPEPELASMQARLAEALANAGRSVEAARIYQQAAAKTRNADTALELQRRAGYQFCISGHVDEGRAAFGAVLEAVHMKLPETPGRALRAFLLTNVALRLRGLRFKQRSEASLSRYQLNRLDVAWSVGTGLGLIDLLNGAYFTLKAVQLALQCGEPYRMIRAMAWEAPTVSSQSPAGKRRGRELIRLCHELVKKDDRPHARAMLALGESILEFTCCAFQRSYDLNKQADGILSTECTGVVWELATLRNFQLFNMHYLGSWNELARQAPLLFDQAQARGDLYVSTNVATTVLPHVYLMSDDARGAEELVRDFVGRWSQKVFQQPNAQAAQEMAWIDLYKGNAVNGLRELNSKWRLLKKNYFLINQWWRALLFEVRSRLAVAAALESGGRAGDLRDAERYAASLEREALPMIKPVTAVVRAGIAHMTGNDGKAKEWLEASIDRAEALHMNGISNTARHQLGKLIGGDAGKALRAQAEQWFKQQGIVNPAGILRMYTPGWE